MNRPIRRLCLTLVLALAATACGTASLNPNRPQAQPLAVDTATPDRSFWRDTVQYPFPVRYGQGRDGRGVLWEIAYMDEYHGPGPRERTPTLVLVHGKGADAGYWRGLMQSALDAGLRVVAFDLPFYGKSIPGNLDKPRNRTLQDTREALHDLLARQLGIERASYLGHSMGGLWALGYALRYPQAVEKLVLVAPAGLEEFPRHFTLPNGNTVPWLDPALADDPAAWERTWPWSARLSAEREKTAEDIRLFNYFKRKDPASGAVVDAPVGYFLQDGPEARFETEARVGMLHGPRAELETWIWAFNWDVYTQGIEVLQDDPNSVSKRVGQIRAPLFIAFGAKDPFIPTPAASGATDLRRDVIGPVYRRLAAAGNPPLVKLYPQAAHFVHLDVPDAFAADVIAFLRDGRVSGPLADPADFATPTASALPQDIAAFVAEDAAAVRSKDLERIMALYSKDFRSDGRGYAETRELFRQFADVLAMKWEVEITGLRIDDDIATLQGYLTNAFARTPLDGTQLIRESGRWKWYGNRK